MDDIAQNSSCAHATEVTSVQQNRRSRAARWVKKERRPNREEVFAVVSATAPAVSPEL
jgi:hypothetical protein